jgi:hypothetical protein
MPNFSFLGHLEVAQIKVRMQWCYQKLEEAIILSSMELRSKFSVPSSAGGVSRGPIFKTFFGMASLIKHKSNFK